MTVIPSHCAECYHDAVNPQRRGTSAENKTTESAAFHIPLPKKALASIKGVSLAAAKSNPPAELSRALDNTLQKMGRDIVEADRRVFAALGRRFANEFKDGTVVDGFRHVAATIDAIMHGNPTFAATVPIILKRDGAQRPELIGSGVLIRILDRTFLLTAAHVTDSQSEGTLLIPSRNGLMEPTGRFSSMKMPLSGRRSDDRSDVAYFWLDEDCVNDLHPEFTVLERDGVSLEGSPALRINYTFAGYPWRKSRIRLKSIETEFFTLTGVEAKQSEYDALGLKPSHHIAIRFHRHRTFRSRYKRVVSTPLPHGLSGGGVYAWSEEALNKWPVSLPLVGVANEYIAERALLVATRLHVYVGCIFHNQPELEAIVGGRV